MSLFLSLFFLFLSFSSLSREKHIYTKIDASKKEALMKKKKGDQKGFPPS
jgi:hypothetical protein